MTKILITGASEKSFIGRHLHKYLTELGYETDTLNREEFMSEDWGRLDNFQLRYGNGDSVKHVKGVAVIPEGYLKMIKPDVLIHCAWIRDDLEATDHLEFAEMSCNMFNECKKRGIRVINLGSSSEYGMKLEPMKEDMNCTPHTTYGIAKLMVTLYAKKLGYNTLRLFAVTGEGGHSFANVCKDAEKWGNPSDKRHIVQVRTVCMAIQRLLHAKHMYGEIINVATNFRSYLEIVKEKKLDNGLDDNGYIDPKGQWDKYPQRQYEPYRWEADLTKMKELLNL